MILPGASQETHTRAELKVARKNMQSERSRDRLVCLYQKLFPHTDRGTDAIFLEFIFVLCWGSPAKSSTTVEIQNSGGELSFLEERCRYRIKLCGKKSCIDFRKHRILKAESSLSA